MEWLNELAQSRELPWLAAFALGLLTAVSPCPLATNVTATAYIAKGFTEKRQVLWSGLLYTAGRALSYTLIGLVVFLGASKFHVARFFQGNGEKLLAPLLIIIGLFMLGVIRLDFPGKMNITEKFSERFKNRGLTGALMLGVLFALAFCPYSGALYFGMLLPMTVASADGLYLPLIFALGTGLPVLLFTYLIAFSIEKVGRYFNAIQRVEKVMRYVAGATFVLAGIYYTFVFLKWI
ncbi:MAG: aromatic aminobenezylarsenical efflux permease ArsG family transporter [Thermoanaerobaculia bacterium]|nr:aromatic aminobenezylarsenical efflux permease ArsG family transporter [Thermoanaerobaculia bacterium]